MASTNLPEDQLPASEPEEVKKFEYNGPVSGVLQNFGGNFTGNTINIAAQQASARLYAETPPPATNRVIGREADLTHLQTLLSSNGCVAVTAIGGQGKSTLAALAYRDWQDRHGPNSAIWIPCGDRNGSRNLSIDEIVLTFAYKILPVEQQNIVQALEQSKPEAQLGWLLQQLQSGAYLLVLDNFESLLQENGRKLVKGKEVIGELLEAASQGLGQSRVLLTSREYPHVTSQDMAQLQLKGLSTEPGSALLKQKLEQREVKTLPGQGDLERAAGPGYTQGNPQFLLWLGQLVDPQKGRSLGHLLEQPGLWQGKIADNLLDQMWALRLKQEERETLKTAAVLRSPFRLADLRGLAVELVQENVAGKVEELSEELQRKGMLEFLEIESLPANPMEAWYGLHPQVREYVLKRKLGQTKRKERHLAAAKYYIQQHVPPRVERIGYGFPLVAPLVEAFFQLVEAKEYDEAADLFFREFFQEDLQRWGQFALLMEMYLKLLPIEGNKHKKVIDDKDTYGILLCNLGNTYFSQGDYDRSIEYQEMSLEIAQASGDQSGEGACYGNLGLAYHKMGNYLGAIQAHKKSWEIFSNINCASGVCQALCNLGCAYYRLGNFSLSIEYNRTALEIAKIIKDKSGEGAAFCNLGLAYKELQDYDNSYFLSQQYIDTSYQIGDMWDIANSLNNLGEVFVAKKEYRQALCYFFKARKTFEVLGLPLLVKVVNDNINELRTTVDLED